MYINYQTKTYKKEQLPPLPKGSYLVDVVSATDYSDIKKAEKGTNYKFKIVDGLYNGRFLYLRVTLDSCNQDHKKWGYEKLDKMSTAIGKDGSTIEDTETFFIGSRMVVDVVVNGQYNNINDFNSPMTHNTNHNQAISKDESVLF